MKKIISLLLLVTSMAFSQTGVTPLNVVQYPSNTINTNTFSIGNKANRSLHFKTNDLYRMKLDSLGNLSLISSNAGFNVATAFRIKNTSSTGFSKLTLDSDDGLTSIGFYNMNSGGTLGAILNNNSAFVVSTATAGTGIINTSAGPIIFNTTSYGTTGEGMRVDKNRNVLIAGAGPTHPVNSGTATALFHIGAGTTTYPAIHLTNQTAPTTPITNDIWCESTRGFVYNGNLTAIGTLSTSSNFTASGTFSAGSTATIGGAFLANSTATITGNQLFTGTTQANGTVNIGPGTFGTDNLHQLRITKGTGTVDIGEYTSGRGAIWVNQNTPSSTNFALSDAGAAGTILNHGTQVRVSIAGGLQINFSNLKGEFGSGLASYDLSFPSTAGTKLGITTSEKIGFWNTTPIIQPVNTTAINAVLVNTGLMASGATTFSSSIAMAIGCATTSVNGSSSGTAVFSQPQQGQQWKKVIVYCSALLGTASYTFPTAFTQTPAVLTTNGPASSVVTALSTTAITITGATTTGFIIIEGY
jgi:hypothetical protein